jgi:mono/diheme cytochrome c family protein
MVKKILIGVGGLAALVVVAVVALFLVASSKLSATVEMAPPPLTAATDEKSLARGKHIFESVCYDCHVQDSSGRAAGGIMPDLPKVVGAVTTANLTSHPAAGIQNVPDGVLARAIRFGIRRDGRRMVTMPLFGMSDEDLSAVLGFLRSNDEIVAPDERVQPTPELSPIGKLAFGMNLAPVPTWPASGLQAPPKAPTVEYGAYLAREVYVCGVCHTAGLDGTRDRGPDAFKGGFKFVDTPEGGIYSTNITFGETGLAKYTLPEFSRALQQGINREGIPLRLPMVRVRNLDEVDVQALYTFLQSVPKAESKLPEDAAPRVKAQRDAGPEKLFSQLGCALCHGEGAKYHERIKPAVGKPAAEVARWIRNPEATLPGTQMPTYHDLLNDEQALELANWVQTYAAKIP